MTTSREEWCASGSSFAVFSYLLSLNLLTIFDIYEIYWIQILIMCMSAFSSCVKKLNDVSIWSQWNTLRNDECEIVTKMKTLNDFCQFGNWNCQFPIRTALDQMIAQRAESRVCTILVMLLHDVRPSRCLLICQLKTFLLFLEHFHF